MRTTTTFDPDVYQRLEAYARERRTTFRQAVNDIVRRGFSAVDAPPAEPFVVRPHRAVFVPGIDPARLNQLLDELDVEDFAAEADKP
jgi:hypothetical protein